MKSFADYISNSQLDELSTNTLRSYSQKAHTQVQDLKFGRGKGQPGSPSAIAKRETGMSAAGARTKKRDDQARASVKREPQKIDPYKPLGGRDQNSGRSYSEGVDHLDELNQMTLSRYAGKARSDINKGVASGDKTKQAVDKLRKRAAGVKTANRKMASGDYSEEVDLDEAASPAARFNQKVKQAQASHEAGDHKKAKYHLDAARNFMLGINSNDHSKIKDSYPQYKKLRDLHTEEVVAEESDLGDLAHPPVTKHRFLVTYSDPNHTMVSKRKEKQQKHILFPGADKKGSTIFKGDAEPLVKKYMNKQGYRVHEVEHVGMVTKRSGK